MKEFFKVFAKVVLYLLIGVLFLYTLYQIYYYRELRQIRRELNAIPDVEVLNIWGSDDVTLEEITARIRIKNKGELVLNSLSKDNFHYPEFVDIPEINGKSFICYTCQDGMMSIGSGLDIGTTGIFSSKIGTKFYKPIDVIKNYDKLLQLIDTFPKFPKFYHYLDTIKKHEYYIAMIDEKSKDIDHLYNLSGIEKKAELGKKFNWKYKKCCQ